MMKPNFELKFWLYVSKDFCMYVDKKPESIFLPKREDVLKTLGISKEQDDAMQLKFANTNSNVNEVDLPRKRERQKGYSAKYYKRKKLG